VAVPDVAAPPAVRAVLSFNLYLMFIVMKLLAKSTRLGPFDEIQTLQNPGTLTGVFPE
jgi:hypothetical protein